MKDKALSISEWCTNYLNHTQELEKGTKLKILDNKDYLRDGAIRMFIKGIAFINILCCIRYGDSVEDDSI